MKEKNISVSNRK